MNSSLLQYLPCKPCNVYICSIFHKTVVNDILVSKIVILDCNLIFSILFKGGMFGPNNLPLLSSTCSLSHHLFHLAEVPNNVVLLHTY